MWRRRNAPKSGPVTNLISLMHGKSQITQVNAALFVSSEEAEAWMTSLAQKYAEGNVTKQQLEDEKHAQITQMKVEAQAQLAELKKD